MASIKTQKSTQKKSNKQLQSNSWWWDIVLKILSVFTSKTPEVIREKAEVKAELKDDIELTKQEVKDIKRDAKIERRIDKAKRAIEVSKLKRGKLIYIKYPGDSKKKKEVFLDYNDNFIITDKGQHKYINAFNWHGRPIIKVDE